MLRTSISRIKIPSHKNQHIHLSEFVCMLHELSNQTQSIQQSSQTEVLSVLKMG